MLFGLSVLGGSQEESVCACERNGLDLIKMEHSFIKNKQNIDKKYKPKEDVPVGACIMSSSRVKHLPPALVILALAVSVNLSAATVNFGTSRSLTSSVTVPTNTTILSLKP